MQGFHSMTLPKHGGSIELAV